MFQKIRVKILTPLPFALTFGGLEIQAEAYRKYLKGSCKIDYFINNETNQEYDILHIVGASIETARAGIFAKNRGKVVIVSPVFYKPNSKHILRVLNLFFGRLRLIPNSFSMVQQLLGSADMILPNSLEELNYLKYIFGLDSKKMTVLRNGIEDSFFESTLDQNRTTFEEKFNLSNQYILNVSMIDRRKNTLRLIKAFNGLDLKMNLVILGDFRFADYRYEKLVKDEIEKASGRVIVTGLIEHNSELMRSAYSGAKFHALPSIIETPGLSSIEALASGLNILVGDCKPVREYFGEAAVYVNPKSITDIKKGLIQCLNKDEEVKDNKEFADKFRWKNISLDLLDLYNKLTKR